MEIRDLRPNAQRILSTYKQTLDLDGAERVPIGPEGSSSAMANLTADIVDLHRIDETEEDLLFGQRNHVRTVKFDQERTVHFEGDAQQGEVESLVWNLKPSYWGGALQYTQFTPSAIHHLLVYLDSNGEATMSTAYRLDRTNLTSSERQSLIYNSQRV